MKKFFLYLSFSILPFFALTACDSTNEHSLTLYFDETFQQELNRSEFPRPLSVGYIVENSNKQLERELSYGYDRKDHDFKYHFFKPKNARYLILSSVLLER